MVSGKACLYLISSGVPQHAGLVPLWRQGLWAFVTSVRPCPLQEMGGGQQAGELEYAAMPGAVLKRLQV